LVGSAAIELLQLLARQYTRSSRSTFPPPDGYSWWTDEAVDELLADMFARHDSHNREEGHKFLINCYLRATDGPSLERLLLTAIENFLKDQAKGTERGKLRRRVSRLLGDDERFEACPGARWTITGGARQPWQGDIGVLERAAFDVRGVEITRWNKAGPTPQRTATALLAVISAVLLHAAGAVRTEDLARVLQVRFNLLRQPRFVSLDDEGTSLVDIALSVGDLDPEVAGRAAHVFESLTQQERTLAPMLDYPKQWAGVLGVGRAEARAVGDALGEKLRLATVDDPDQEAVTLRVIALCGGASGVS
jgi:hypothetical protein